MTNDKKPTKKKRRTYLSNDFIFCHWFAQFIVNLDEPSQNLDKMSAGSINSMLVEEA